MTASTVQTSLSAEKKEKRKKTLKKIKRYWAIYLMMLPGIIYLSIIICRFLVLL